MPMNITIATVPYAKMRYATCGDWQFDGDGNLSITVSELGDWRKEAAIALHEMAEALLCRNDGVTTEQVDAFDLAHLDADEPGELPGCPYGEQHRVAEVLERVLIGSLGMTWREHQVAVAALGGEPSSS